MIPPARGAGPAALRLALAASEMRAALAAEVVP
jgi:hypothetical protein